MGKNKALTHCHLGKRTGSAMISHVNASKNSEGISSDCSSRESVVSKAAAKASAAAAASLAASAIALITASSTPKNASLLLQQH